MNDIYLENIELNGREFKNRKTALESKMTRIMVNLTNKCKLCRRVIRKKDLIFPEEYIVQIEKLFPYLDYIPW